VGWRVLEGKSGKKNPGTLAQGEKGRTKQLERGTLEGFIGEKNNFFIHSIGEKGIGVFRRWGKDVMHESVMVKRKVALKK